MLQDTSSIVASCPWKLSCTQALCFPDADRMEVDETTPFANENEAFALEPVPITRKNDSLPWAHKICVHNAVIR